MAQRLETEMKDHIELTYATDADTETKEPSDIDTVLVYDTKETEIIHRDNTGYNGINVKEEDLVEEAFVQNNAEEFPHLLFYFGNDNPIFYAMKPSENNQESPPFYECYSLNTKRPSQWPDIIYLMDEQLQKVQFIKRESDTEKAVLDNYSLYGLKEGFLFHVENETDLVYIIDKIMTPPNTDYVYRCTKINSDKTNEFPNTVYLTKHQLLFTKQVLGLNWLKYRAIYNDQQHEMKKLEDLSIKHKDIDSTEAKLKLLRDEFMNYYFVIKYHNRQIVYYVSEIKDVDTFICRLSRKNALDTLLSKVPYPSMIVLNNVDIHDAETFGGSGCMLSFDEDIYSLYASFYTSKQKTPTMPISLITLFTLLVQLMSILAIIWCFDVAYTEDVIKYYTIDQMQQCGFISNGINDTDTNDTDINMTPFCIHLDGNYTYALNNTYTGTFALIEDNGATQEFDEEQHWWYLIGYAGTAGTSLLVLTFYVYKNAVAPIKIRIALLYCDDVAPDIIKKVKRIVYCNISMVLFAYAVGVWSILTYPIGKGISNPHDVLALPISVVFVLEIDDWMFHIVQIGYTKYIQSSFGIEITKSALADFGTKSWNMVRMFLYFQAFTCLASLVWAMTDPTMIVSIDVYNIWNNITGATFVFVFLIMIAFILSDKNAEKTKKIVVVVILLLLIPFLFVD